MNTMTPQTSPVYTLTVTCQDTVGIAAATLGHLAEQDLFITDSSHHGDPETGLFFMRTSFRSTDHQPVALDRLRASFASIAERFGMQWDLVEASRKPQVMIAVSKFGHCLNDLLQNWRTGCLKIEIPAVVSNHNDFRDLVEWYGIPFYHLPITPETKPQQEEKFLNLFSDLKCDLLVLARYMQVLSPNMCRTLSGRAINIHHSFLPSFKGAKPYQQAHAKGVKIIGATAHYVTDDLDEGPIIEQDVERVDHTATVEDLVRTGRDIETRVLSRAVRWHVEKRVFVNGRKTIVFR